MIYRRATKQLYDAGIAHIVIVKRLLGAVPEDIRAKRQTAQCFDSWEEATQAVLNGYRPVVQEFKPSEGPIPMEEAVDLYLDQINSGEFFETTD